jgi:CBS domain-containing protein
MSTVREIMTANAECAGERETLQVAARKMRDLNVGALPICGEDQRLKGMVTDRDIVVKCVAAGGDPATATTGELAQGTLVWIEADRAVEEAWQLMAKNRVRRLPVLDNNRRLVGIVSQGDVARHLPSDRVGELVEAISAAP